MDSNFKIITMKRILHIVGGMNRAGAETMLMNLYRKIDRSKIQFDFVVFTNKKGDYDDEIIKLGGRLFIIKNSNPALRTLALKSFLKKNSQYKIVHCHTLLSNSMHLLAAKWANVPYRIAHSHNTGDNSKKKLTSFIYKNLAKILIKKLATHFVSCGKEAAIFLFGKNTNAMQLPNAVDFDKLAQIGESEKMYLNKNFKIKKPCLKIIQVGRLEVVKNPFFSLKLAENLKSKNIDFKLFFVGQGSLKDNIEDDIKNKKLSDCVKLLGVRSDIPELMAGADVLLMPSFHEGFPVVLVESQSVGLPALIADSISKEVDLDVNLIKFESLDSDFSIWIEKLLGLTDEKIMNSNLRKKIIQEKGFDIRSNVKKLSNLYNAMV